MDHVVDLLHVLNHREMSSAKSALKANFAAAKVALQQHCIRRATKYCNLRTVSIDDATSRLASEIQELENAINTVKLHCDETDQCLSSPSYSSELQTHILSLQEEAGAVYYGVQVYTYLYSVLTEYTIYSYIINVQSSLSSARDKSQFEWSIICTRRVAVRCKHQSHEPTQRLKAYMYDMTRHRIATPNEYRSVTNTTADKTIILHGDNVIRSGSLTHQDVHNLRNRALKQHNDPIHLGRKGWISDGQLIDDADYSGLMQMLVPLVEVPNLAFPLCF